MARFAVIEDNVVVNIIEASEEYGNKIGAIYVEPFPQLHTGDIYEPETGKFYRNEEEIPKVETKTEKLKSEIIDIKLALAELAQIQEMDKTDIQLALAELADIIVGGGENG